MKNKIKLIILDKKIKEILDSLIVATQMTADEEFTYGYYKAGRKDAPYSRWFPVRRKAKQNDIREFTFDVFIINESTMKVRVRESYRNDTLNDFVSKAYQNESLFTYQIDVQKEYIDIYFKEPHELLEIFNVLFENSELAV